MLIRVLVLIALLATTGCSGDGDIKKVNFTHTIDVARPATALVERQPLRVAVASMVSPKETFIHYREILDYIGNKLDKEVHLVQRKTYGEINDLLAKGKIDLAFICSGPYSVESKDSGVQLLAVPEIQGSHLYQGYLIVNEKSRFNRLEDLKGKSFAFTDPDSNTGRLLPVYWLATMNEQPETFFGQTLYTYSHDNSILAVAKGMVDGATVDGLVWEYYNREDLSLTSKTRIIRKSEPYGNPPLVASRQLSVDLKERISNLLLSMHEDPAGRTILGQLMIDRFVTPEDSWYDNVRQMFASLKRPEGTPHGPSKP